MKGPDEIKISVIIPTHNPRTKVLERTLTGLSQQTLPVNQWEIVLVDNASAKPVRPELPNTLKAHTQIITENTLGLTAARLAGFNATTAPLIVMVDDDNVLAEDYLEQAMLFAEANPAVGTFGGKSIPEFEVRPPAWFADSGLSLGCRDLGQKCLQLIPPPQQPVSRYPALSPIGAGMVLRRAVAEAYASSWRRGGIISDRRGGSLSSGGDCDINLTALSVGYGVAYVPDLVLTHLIPAARLTFAYLKRMSRDSNRSWVSVLDKHHISPWPPVSPWGYAPRLIRAFFRVKPWQDELSALKWQAVQGKLEGQLDGHKARRLNHDR